MPRNVTTGQELHLRVVGLQATVLANFTTSCYVTVLGFGPRLDVSETPLLPLEDSVICERSWDRTKLR